MILGVSIDKKLSIILELVDGESLQDLIQEKELAIPQILDIAYQAAEALAYLHQRLPRGIIHKDLKPSNILISKKGEVKLCDLGESKLIFTSIKKTQHGGPGTAHYSAPELFDRKSYLTFGVDA